MHFFFVEGGGGGGVGGLGFRVSGLGFRASLGFRGQLGGIQRVGLNCRSLSGYLSSTAVGSFPVSSGLNRRATPGPCGLDSVGHLGSSGVGLGL